MATVSEVSDLPLLHKYVLVHGEDMQLQMTKLRYRLCVQEVSDIQGNRLSYREPGVTSAVVKPHDMLLDGDLTSHDDVTHQQHLSAKSPMSDDSGVVIDENHMEHNGSVPMTPEGEETKWEEGHQHESTNGAWPEDDRRDEQPMDTHHRAHHDNDAVFTEPDATKVEGVAEETSMVEVARPTADNTAAAADAEPAKDAEVTPEHQHSHQLADEAIVEHRTALDESAPSTESECRRTEEVKHEEASPKEVMETEPIIESGESKVEEAEPKTEQKEFKVEETESKVEEAESKVDEAESKVEEAEAEPEVVEPTPVEPEEPVDDDKDRIDFVPGVHCDNVMDALSILKNKYRLSRSVSKKNVITFSCWNLKDVTNTPSHVVNANRLSQPVAEEDERMIDILDDILSKEKEIDRLLEQVLEKERENEHKTAEAKRLSAKQGGGGVENDLPVIEESLQAADVATSPVLESVPPQASSSPPGQSKEDMKKKRSRLVRMLQALRRRLGGGGRR